jgi:3'(2'), 5'-bisphosphate nucleotidase
MKINFEGLPTINLRILLTLAKEAGKGVLTVYNGGDIAVTLKGDRSPLTLADQISHEIIMKGLTVLNPGIPVISEEGKDIPYEVRKNWEYFWCVDPLDGTKEFIKRNGEFTVNIALIHKNVSVLGIIYVPVTGELYYGGEGISSWKENATGEIQELHANRKTKDWIAVGSRSHSSAEEITLLNRYPITETVSIGSSIKFCLIAEGKADIYYRRGPTMEWDTAAGQAIATYSGAVMSNSVGEPFVYNKPSLLNGGFLVKIK